MAIFSKSSKEGEFTLNGYRVTPKGLSIWPLRRLYRSWDQLEAVQIRPSNKRDGLFGVGFYFQKRRSPVVFSGPPFDGVFKVLDVAIVYGPETVKIAPEVLDLIERFKPKVEDSDSASLEEIAADADRFLGLKENRKARKLLKIAEKQGADFPTYHIARAKLMLADGVSHKRILNYLEKAHESFPDDQDLRMFFYWHALTRRNESVAADAEDYWQNKKEPPVLAALLCDYWVNRGLYPRATDTLREAILETEDPEAVKALNRKLEDVEKLQKSPLRRFARIIFKPLTKDWRTPRWFSIAFYAACLVGGIAFAYWMNETQREQDRAREQREFERQEAIRLEPIRLREKAEAGDVNAMAELWEAYRYGSKRGFSKDPELQLYWMTKAADAGHSESIRQLAFAYQDGEIVEKNLTTAFYWFSKGAEAGGSWSMWEVAHYYYLGIEPVEQNFEGSLYWYSQACKDDRGYAQMYVGWHYEMGLGIERDLDKAYQFYRYASEKGKWWATERLSVLCYDPTSPFYSPKDGWNWFTLALEQAHGSQKSWQEALRRKNIRNKFPHGPFFNMGIWVTPTKANIRKWFQIGAEHGDAYCAWKLSKLYLDGFFGGDDDIRRGAELLDQAIEQKLPHAVWYGSIMLSDPETPLFNPDLTEKLKAELVELQFPPAGPYFIPELPSSN